MKKNIILIITLTLASAVHAQTINLQGGTSISKLNWDLESINSTSPKYDKALVAYSIFAGMDYFDKPYYNLSSNIGMIRKGGAHNLYAQTALDKLTLDYLSVNTTIDIKYPVAQKYIPFISIGPRLDFLVNHSQHFDIVKDANELKPISIGMLLGAGIKTNIKDFQLGLRADYYLNFNPIADWRTPTSNNGGHITGNTFAISLSVGYKLEHKN
jgi:hypothetical protein